ncbi:MAG: RICIN domain-containing protein [Prevotella sp.]|nr:RICIN domain-containing protein [Prevotella sp.]
MRHKRLFIVALGGLLFATTAHSQTERPWSSSVNLRTNATTDCTIPFCISDPGKQLPIRWGLDVAWISEQNIRKGINHIGKENLSLVRGSFQTTYALIGDTRLTSYQQNVLKERLRLANLVGDDVDLVLNEDQEQGIIPYYTSNGVADVGHWANLIDATVAWIHDNTKHKVVAVSPFNEPDFTQWGQGTLADFKDIAKELKENYPRFKDIDITGGNTLNNDRALEWYNGLKPYVKWGNTHQLAGSFDTFVDFYKRVVADGNYAYADELHNVGEAMVGAEYGVKAAVWWGFDSRARGEFCRISNHGSRIGYGENRGAWTMASVYRNDETGDVKAFVGSSERQANKSSFLFLTDREVYYDGQGPFREFRMEIPGGGGYQSGQTNAERVIDVKCGEDVPPSAISGRYKIVNRASGMVVAINGTRDGHPNISQVAYTGDKTQQWDVVLVDPRIGGDYSFYKITNVNDGKYMNVLDNSTRSQANVIAYNANCASNEQWYLEYAGDGFYYIKNRESGLYLDSQFAFAYQGGNIRQATLRAENERAAQQWRFLPLDAECEFEAPMQPSGLIAKTQSASVRLDWTANNDADLDGYIVLRAKADSDDWDVIARKVPYNAFVDNSCKQGVQYKYKVKAIDKSENLSVTSVPVSAMPGAERALVANWQFENDLLDNTENQMDGIHSASPTFTKAHKSGETALNLMSNAYLQLPYEVADMDEMTIAMWVNWRSSSTSWSRIFDFGNGTDHYMFLTPNNGSVMRFAIKNGGDEQQVDCKSKLQSNVWKHVAVAIGKEKTTIFINGEEAASSTNVTIRPSDIRSSLNYVGRSQFKQDPTFIGFLDDMRIYNYALTADEVKNVMEDLTNSIDVAPSIDSDAALYNIGGIKEKSPNRGVVIKKESDGTTRKMVVK